MSVAAIVSVQQEIANVIKRFKFEELESLIMLTFPEISWTNLKSDLVKHHKSFKSSNVAQLIKATIIEAKIQEKALNDRLSTLKLIDVSWHSTKRIWYGYTLMGSNKSMNYIMNREIQTDMQRYFDSLNLKICVKVNTHDGITYVSLTEGKSKSKIRKIQRPIPIFLALFAGQKYFFCTKKDVSSNILNAIVRSLGYKDSKRFKLMGRDLRSLSELCWRKKEGAVSLENITKILMYQKAAPERQVMGINFTGQKQRKKYAEECFGSNPPTLELLVINGPSLPVLNKDISAKLLNENIRLTWEFRSRNIATLLSKLIEKRILTTPVPNYVSNLMVLGKNELTLRRSH